MITQLHFKDRERKFLDHWIASSLFGCLPVTLSYSGIIKADYKILIRSSTPVSTLRSNDLISLLCLPSAIPVSMGIGSMRDSLYDVQDEPARLEQLCPASHSFSMSGYQPAYLDSSSGSHINGLADSLALHQNQD